MNCLPSTANLIKRVLWILTPVQKLRPSPQITFSHSVFGAPKSCRPNCNSSVVVQKPSPQRFRYSCILKVQYVQIGHLSNSYSKQMGQCHQSKSVILLTIAASSYLAQLAMQLAGRILGSERHLVSQATCPNRYGDSLPTIVFSSTLKYKILRQSNEL